jgi:hypothetical protein
MGCPVMASMMPHIHMMVAYMEVTMPDVHSAEKRDQTPEPAYD